MRTEDEFLGVAILNLFQARIAKSNYLYLLKACTLEACLLKACTLKTWKLDHFKLELLDRLPPGRLPLGCSTLDRLRPGRPPR